MKKIYQNAIVEECKKKCKYMKTLCQLPIDMFIIKYDEGEFVNSPFDNEQLFQIIVSGSLGIYLVRDDGSRYALSSGGIDYIIGDMDLFHQPNESIYAEAEKNLVTLAFSMDKYKEILLANSEFLRLVAESLSSKIGQLATFDAAHASLEERVISYMKYKCEDATLKGIEQSAFQLHCSSRHLQRIMNKFCEDNTVVKLGKGTYQLQIK